MADAPPPIPKLTFRRRHRLSRSLDYQAVYRRAARRVRGPMVVFALPSGRPESRLGLSVGRRVGGAVKRNVIKRRLREAFRLAQGEIPAGYDIVVNVRPHEPVTLAEYQKLLVSCCRAMHEEWQRGGPRQRQDKPGARPEAAPGQGLEDEPRPS